MCRRIGFVCLTGKNWFVLLRVCCSLSGFKEIQSTVLGVVPFLLIVASCCKRVVEGVKRKRLAILEVTEGDGRDANRPPYFLAQGRMHVSK